MTDHVTRRSLLMTAAGVAGTALVTSCTPDSPGSGSSTSPSGSDSTVGEVIPTYQANAQVEADLDAGDPEIPQAFFAYPAARFASTSTAPLAGETISSAAESIGPVPSGAANNQYWRGLNERLGGTLEMIITPGAEHIAKVQSLVAGGDLPDIVQLKPATPNLPSLLEAKFADLSAYLSGDEVLNFPNLAAIPSYAWESCIFNGKLFGVPFAQPLLSNGLAVRADVAKSLDLPTQVSDGPEFLDWCRTMTDEKAGRWALTKPDRIVQYVLAPMFGAPNTWRLDGDTFVSWYETDAFAQAVETARQMWSEGLFHPDSMGTLPPDLFGAGKVVLDQNGLTAWGGARARSGNPEYELEMVLLPTWDGSGKAKMSQLNGIYTFAGVAQGDAAQVRQRLGVINWLAGPIGSEEHLYATYGEEGIHFEFNDAGDPIPTGSVDETKVPTSYLGRTSPYIYSPDDPEFAQTQFDYHQAAKPGSLPLPTRGLSSPTDLNEGGNLRSLIFDDIFAVIADRKAMTDWPDAVENWKSQGGEKIAQEYSESLQAQ